MPQDLDRARKWYFWLWLSPILTVPTALVVLFVVSWFYYVSELRSIAIAVLASAAWHLVLIIPTFNRKSAYIRWHGYQALSLAAVRTALPIIAFSIDPEAIWVIPLLIIIWLGGTFWGQRQAKRGNCSLMRWFGREEELAAMKVRWVAESKENKEQAVEAWVQVIRTSSDRMKRRKALARLEKLGLVESL